MRTVFIASLVLLYVACCVSAQQIWNVNCQGGTEVHFTDLPQAVAAAAPGDEIRVYIRFNQPSCQGLTYYTAPVIDKPLRIVGFRLGAGGLSVPSVGLRGGILITGLAADEQVVLSHLSIAQGSGVSGIAALNCQGSIILEDCYYGSAGGIGSYMRFEHCHEVVVRGCEFQLGGSPLEVIDTNLLITTSRIDHIPPLPTFFPTPGPFAETAPGLRVTNSTVTITESLVYGSDSYNDEFNTLPQFLERPGMIIDSGTVRVGPGAFVSGGWHPQQYYPYGYPAPGYLVTGPNVTVELDARGTIYDTSFPPPIPTEIHAVAHNWITAGEAYEVLVAGPLGGFAVLAVGDWLPGGVATPFGSLAIDPMTLQVDAVVPLSTTDGRYHWPLTCPTTIPVAHAFAFQAAVLSPTGMISLTVPSPFAVGWSAAAIP